MRSINSGNIHGTIYPINSYDMFVFKAGPLKGSGAYFYSSLTESYAYVSFQDTPVLYFDIKNRVAVATSQDKSQTYLYDANTNGVTSIDFSYHYYELGDNFILFAKDNDSVTSYNFTRQEFSHITLNDRSACLEICCDAERRNRVNDDESRCAQQFYHTESGCSVQI